LDLIDLMTPQSLSTRLLGDLDQDSAETAGSDQQLLKDAVHRSSYMRNASNRWMPVHVSASLLAHQDAVHATAASIPWVNGAWSMAPHETFASFSEMRWVIGPKATLARSKLLQWVSWLSSPVT
jgi:hypothetical protein